jgi:hypothetical protein
MFSSLLFVLGSYIEGGTWFVFGPTGIVPALMPRTYVYEYPFITMGTACKEIDSSGKCVEGDWKKAGTLYDIYSADAFGTVNSGLPLPLDHYANLFRGMQEHILKSYYCEASQWLPDQTSLPLASITAIISGKLMVQSGVALCYCGLQIDNLRWAQSLEEQGFAGILLLYAHTYGLTGLTFADGDLRIPMWVFSQNAYQNTLLNIMPTSLVGIFSNTFLQFNSTWWDVPHPYLSTAGDVMFVAMVVVQVASILVAALGLRLVLKARNFPSLSAFIFIWEGSIGSGFRIFRLFCEPLSTGGGRFAVKWHWFMFSSTCEGFLAAPSSIMMVALFWKTLMKTKRKVTAKFERTFGVVVFVVTAFVTILLLNYVCILVWTVMEKGMFRAQHNPLFYPNMSAHYVKATEATMGLTIGIIAALAFVYNGLVKKSRQGGDRSIVTLVKRTGKWVVLQMIMMSLLIWLLSNSVVVHGGFFHNAGRFWLRAEADPTIKWGPEPPGGGPDFGSKGDLTMTEPNWIHEKAEEWDLPNWISFVAVFLSFFKMAFVYEIVSSPSSSSSSSSSSSLKL